MGASGGAIRAGNAFLEFTLKDGALRKGLKKWEGRFRSFGKNISLIGGAFAGIGGSVLTGLGGAAKVFADSGSELNDMHKRTGLSVESLSELRYAAKQSGVALEDVEKAAHFLQKRGIDPKKFDQIAAKIAGIEDPTKRAQAAMKEFGKKTGPALLPMLDGLAEARQKARDLGLVMSEEDATAADDLGDNYDTLWDQLKRVIEVIGAAIAGPLTELLKATQPILKSIIDWISANRAMIQTVAAVAAVVFVLGGVLIGIGVGFQVLAFAAAGVSAAIGAVGAVIGFLLSPIGLVIAAVAGVVVWFTTMTETGRTMVANLVGWFGELAAIAKASFGAIAAALGAGDIAAAGDVLWATLKLLWLQGTAGLRETWQKLTGSVVSMWHMAWAGMLQLANSAWGNLERGWSHTTEFFGNLWDGVVGSMQVSLNNLIGFFQKAWAFITGASDEEIARINKEVVDSNAILSGDAAGKQQSRSAAAEQARNESRNLQDATLNAIGDELAAKLSATDSSTKDKIAASQQQLDDARAAWKDATAAANAIGAANDLKKAEMATAGNAAAAGLDDGIAKSSSLGTFSADAIISLQSGGAQEETAENTRAMRRSLDRMERVKGGALVATA